MTLPVRQRGPWALAACLIGAGWALPAQGQQESLAVGLARSAVHNLRPDAPPPPRPVQEAALGLFWILSDIRGARRDDIDRVFEEENVLDVLESFTSTDATLQDFATKVRTKVETRLRAGRTEALDVEAETEEDAEMQSRRMLPRGANDYAWLRFQEPEAGREYELQLLDCEQATNVVVLGELAGDRLEYLMAGSAAAGAPLVIPEAPGPEPRRYYAKISFPEACPGIREVALVSRKAVPPLPAVQAQQEAAALEPLAAATVYRGRLGDEGSLFARFDGAANTLYQALTFSLGPELDTVVAVYDEEGVELVSDDDGGGGLSSRAIWFGERPRTYTIEIRGISSSQGSFDIKVDTVAAATRRAGATEADAQPLPPDGTIGVVQIPSDSGVGWLRFDAVARTIYRVRSNETIKLLTPGGVGAIPYWGDVDAAAPAAGKCLDEELPLDLGYVETTYWVALAPGQHLVEVRPDPLAERPSVLAVDVVMQMRQDELEPVSLTAGAAERTKLLLDRGDSAAKVYEVALAGEAALYGSFEAQQGETVTARVLPIDRIDGVAVAFVGVPDAAEEEAEASEEDATDEEETPREDGEKDEDAGLEALRPEEEEEEEEEDDDEDEDEDAGTATREIQSEGVFQLRINNPARASGKVFLEVQKGRRFDGWEEGQAAVLGCHRPVRGNRNWTAEMNAYVGETATIQELAGTDGSGSWIVRVDLDEGTYVWRTRDLKRPPG